MVKRAPRSVVSIEAAANSIVLIMLATFVVMLACLYWKHNGTELPPPATPSVAAAHPVHAAPRVTPKLAPGGSPP
jgi:hypothetical protein